MMITWFMEVNGMWIIFPPLFVMSVRSLSPPTRDVAQDDKSTAEISRLNAEITNSLQQIRSLLLQRCLHTGWIWCLWSSINTTAVLHTYQKHKLCIGDCANVECCSLKL